MTNKLISPALALSAALVHAAPADAATVDATDAGSSYIMYDNADAADDILNDSAIHAVMERAGERARILNHKTLGDQAPDSPWNVNPVEIEPGKAVCFASITDSIQNATVRNLDDSLLSDQEKEQLAYNTMSAVTQEDGTTHIRLGFDAENAPMVTALGVNNRAERGSASLASVIEVQSELFAEGNVAILAQSTNDHLIQYTIEAPFPEAAFADCNEAAANGVFDAEFNAIADNLIAQFHVPADQDVQATLKEEFTQGGLCNAGFNAEEFGNLTQAGFYTPANIGGFNAERNMAAGDILSAVADRFSRSKSYNAPADAPSFSGCAGDIEPVCTETVIDTNPATGDKTVSYMFCEKAQEVTPPVFITPNTPVTPVVFEIPKTIVPVIIPGNPNNPGTFIPVDPTDPVDPIDPIVPPPAPVPGPASIFGLLAGLGALGGIAARRRKPSSVESLTNTQPSAPALDI